MSEDFVLGFVIIALLVVALACVALGSVGHSVGKREVRREAVLYGHAEFVGGDDDGFRWITEEK